MHAKPSLPKLQLALLDKHTTKLCSAHAYPPCVFCAKHPNEHPDKHPCRTLITCSKCGFLSHKDCLSKFLMVDNNSASFNEICPRCGQSSHRLESSFVNGHRNFSHVLRHCGCATLVPTFNLHQPIPINQRLNNSVKRGNNEEPFLQLITTNPDTGTGSDNRPQLRDVWHIIHWQHNNIGSFDHQVMLFEIFSRKFNLGCLCCQPSSNQKTVWWCCLALTIATLLGRQWVMDNKLIYN